MTEAPLAFADAPTRRLRSPPLDVLADVLRAVRLTGAVFLTSRLTAPFGITVPKRYDPCMPMARLRHVSVFHLIVSGGCMIETRSGDRRRLTAGDVVLLPFSSEHKLWSGEPAAFVSVTDAARPGPIEGVWTADHGGGGAGMKMVCGFIESSEFLFAPLFRTLPGILIENTGAHKAGALIASTVCELLSLIDAAAPGTQMMLGRMMEILFVEMLRRHAGRLSADGSGWLGALNDPIVGQALQLLHMDPARKWNVADLAREAATSRTVLAERFNALLGRPPIEYVTCWRIQLAADRLRNGREAIAAIAADVGYESEAAFARAFKRVTGISPGRWRNGEGDSAPLMPLALKTPLLPRRATAGERDLRQPR